MIVELFIIAINRFISWNEFEKHIVWWVKQRIFKNEPRLTSMNRGSDWPVFSALTSFLDKEQLWIFILQRIDWFWTILTFSFRTFAVRKWSVRKFSVRMFSGGTLVGIIITVKSKKIISIQRMNAGRMLDLAVLFAQSEKLTYHKCKFA